MPQEEAVSSQAAVQAVVAVAAVEAVVAVLAKERIVAPHAADGVIARPPLDVVAKAAAGQRVVEARATEVLDIDQGVGTFGPGVLRRRQSEIDRHRCSGPVVDDAVDTAAPVHRVVAALRPEPVVAIAALQGVVAGGADDTLDVQQRVRANISTGGGTRGQGQVHSHGRGIAPTEIGNVKARATVDGIIALATGEHFRLQRRAVAAHQGVVSVGADHAFETGEGVIATAA